MVKRITTAFSLLLSLAATLPAMAQKKERSSGTNAAKHTLKFLDAIEIPAGDAPETNVVTVSSTTFSPEPTNAPKPENTVVSSIESASALQLKYAVLLDIEVEAVQNKTLFEAIDEWYGTRYELGGNSKNGIDCSAFVQAVYAKLFQIPMPRTTKEQYKAVASIAKTDLKEGDLIFFNTRGSGVSHVGIYLQNNKFVHAATSNGVMVSDLNEDYWMKHYIGAGRLEQRTDEQPLTLQP